VKRHLSAPYSGQMLFFYSNRFEVIGDMNDSFSKRVEQCYFEALNDLKKLQIKVPADAITLSINKRAKRRLGCCKHNRRILPLRYEIEISEVCSDLSDFELRNIVMHELVHTCPGCMNHCKQWKELIRKINAAFGYNITTTADYKRLGLDDAVAKPIYNYKVTCVNCGQSLYRMKRSKLISNPGLYRCSHCGGRLEVKKINGK